MVKKKHHLRNGLSLSFCVQIWGKKVGVEISTPPLLLPTDRPSFLARLPFVIMRHEIDPNSEKRERERKPFFSFVGWEQTIINRG